MNYNKSLIDYLLKIAKVKDPALRGAVRLFWNSLQEMVAQQIKAPSIFHYDGTVILKWTAEDIRIEVWIDPDSTFVWSTCGIFSYRTYCLVDMPPIALSRFISSRFVVRPTPYETRQLQLGLLYEHNVTYGEIMSAMGLSRPVIAKGFHCWSSIKRIAEEGSLSAMLEVDGINPDRVSLYLKEMKECGAILIDE